MMKIMSKKEGKKDGKKGGKTVQMKQEGDAATNIKARERGQMARTMSQKAHAETANDPLDQYKVGPVVGQGAFAVVKHVTSKRTGEEFALKLIDKRWTKASAMELELSVLKAVGRHRNVVSMIDHFELPSAYGVVLELATGGEVFDRICERGTYSERDAAALVRQVGGALQHVHSAQVVHRDIKPENLLHVDTSDHAAVKLCDFGLSVFYGEGHPAPTSADGTVSYMAPEMIREREYGPEVDLWAIGVVLFILLGGFHPFDPDGLADDKRVVKEIKAGNWSFDDPVWKEVSAEAKGVLKGLLAPSPQQRPTATQLLALPWVRGDTASDAQLSTAAAQLRTFNEARRTWRAAAAAAAMVARGADASNDLLGLQWENVGESRPGGGDELTNPKLAFALKSSTSLQPADLKAFGLEALEPTDFIKSGSSYFKPVAQPLSEDAVEEMRVAFTAFDRDGSGTIDTSELSEAMARMGFGEDEKQAAIRRVKVNSDGTIPFAEFCRALAPVYAYNSRLTGAAGALSEETVEEMRVAFNAFDEDGSGSIDISELGQAMARMGMGEADTQAAMRRVDANSDGTISFAEFCTAMAPLYSDNTRMLKRAFVVFDVDGSGYIDKEATGPTRTHSPQHAASPCHPLHGPTIHAAPHHCCCCRLRRRSSR